MVFQRIMIKTLDLHCNTSTDNGDGKLQFVLCSAITYVIITVHYINITVQFTVFYCSLVLLNAF